MRMGSAISRTGSRRSLSFIVTGNSTGACAPAPGPVKLIWCPAPSTVTTMRPCASALIVSRRLALVDRL
jgi:hypothetical protein